VPLRVFQIGFCADDLLAKKVEAAVRIVPSALLLRYLKELIEVS
jgi:hypothetical protein